MDDLGFTWTRQTEDGWEWMIGDRDLCYATGIEKTREEAKAAAREACVKYDEEPTEGTPLPWL